MIKNILKEYNKEININFDILNNLVNNAQYKEKRTKTTLQKIEFNNDICFYCKWVLIGDNWQIKSKRLFLKDELNLL